MATQMWQPFLVAMVMTRVSRASGLRVEPSKIALSFMNPSRSCGEAAIRAAAAGRYPRCCCVAVIVRRAAGGADSMVSSGNVCTDVCCDMLDHPQVR